ncbi:Neur_chan_memb domain-containing protein [Caenorhabditis elegans]|uniref:Neur_chan_memb domain-containing protein n=1 Tax=Caenorhabditis elegans TaxID=6239 RepID=A0A0M7RFG1_CAEEL|nr:Neur_chan_memb domain-containing protein [Caenorhabditis elegans]CUR30030.1 Neur_chan_memb domain-containing protein [Caenorhabditis elegans]|eukprot:NP_001303731.1 AcetylCholine Receptor [Caenorhabditis elegans]
MISFQLLLRIVVLHFLMGLAMAQQKQLIKYLFRDYHKELRPVKDESSGPTNVTVQLYFKQIQKVHENDQIITLYCWIEEYWQDEFLTWNPSDFGNIKSLHVPSEMIWKPDLLVYNNANMNIKENEMQTNVQIEHTGKISLFRAIITDITCDLQMEKFPYDQQICFIMLASWSYDGSQIMLNTAEQPTEAPLDIKNTTNLAILNHYIPNMEWKLVDFRYRNNLKYYDCCPNPYPDISYFFAIKRNPSYYLFTLIIPSAFITIVTVIGFFTPHSSTGENTEKVSLGVTALLSLAIILMMVSDKLPATSNSVPLLGQYYIGLIFIMFLATYCTTFTLGIQMQGNAGRPITRRLRSFLLSIRMNRNSFVQWFFGRELMNTQESIKMRLKKYHNKTASLIEQESIDSSKLLDPAMYNVVVDVLSSVQSIRQDLTSQEHLKRIRKEWQMLARMLEKIIMWIFIISTVAFASFMLYDTQDPPIITNEVMRSKST